MPTNPDLEALEKIVTIGFAVSAQAIRRESGINRVVAQSNYQGHTGNGKARFVEHLAKSLGSSKKAADYLDLSESRISQLRKTARKNGK